MYRKNIFIILFCFSLAVSAQVSSKEAAIQAHVFPKETTQLTTNTTVLLAGESLLYKIDALTATKTKSSLSKRAYVTLKSTKDSVVFFHKLKLVNGMATGDFFVPATLKTGLYRLMAYTNFSRNNTENRFDEKEIYIINSFQSNPITQNENMDLVTIEATENAIKVADTLNFKGISVVPNKTSYSKRDGVTLTLKNAVNGNGFGTYSLSVRKVDAVQCTKSKSSPTTKNTNETTFYIPEIRGELISGRVEAVKGGASVEGVTLGLTIPGKNFIYKTAITNASGHFFFSIDESYSTAHAMLQVETTNKESYTIVLDSKEIATSVSNQEVIIDESSKPWLQERSIQLQIANAYFNANTIQIVPEVPSAPFYTTLGTNYVLNDYTRFKTVKETFVEVVTSAGIRTDDGITKFVIFDAYDPNRTAQFSNLPPLLLMDGMLVQNPDEILEYNASGIHSIRVISQAYRYGFKMYSGIISITTTKGDFVPRLQEDYMTTFQLQSIEPSKEVKVPNYSTNRYDRIPDYRNQLYWEPALVIDSESTPVNFYTSDVTGTFQVVLEGYSDQGTYMYTTASFIVE